MERKQRTMVIFQNIRCYGVMGAQPEIHKEASIITSYLSDNGITEADLL